MATPHPYQCPRCGIDMDDFGHGWSPTQKDTCGNCRKRIAKCVKCLSPHVSVYPLMGCKYCEGG